MDSCENLLICLSDTPSDAKVIRIVAQLTRILDGKVPVFLIKPSGLRCGGRKSREHFLESIRFAESLGAQTVTLSGGDIAEQIAGYACRCKATKIVLIRRFYDHALLASERIKKRIAELSPNTDVIIISGSLPLIKSQTAKIVQRACHAKALFKFGRNTKKEDSDEEILTLMAAQIGILLEKNVIIYPVSGSVLQKPIRFSLDTETENHFDAHAYEAALQMVRRGNGANAGEYSGAGICAFPIKDANDTTVAIVCIHKKNWKSLTGFEQGLLSIILDECGVKLENANSIRVKKAAEALARNRELRSNLFKSISHDLRTPLIGILGNAELLIGNELDEDERQQVYMGIRNDSAWLISLVENLLSMARIEDGKAHVRMLPELMKDVFEETLEHINPDSAAHNISVRVSDEFLMAYMDARLIVQVMINLINNAIQYTPKDSHIMISADAEGNQVLIQVADDGPGISDTAKERIFDLFYTADNECGDRRRGTGLGLALCRSIVSAHDSKLEVSDNTPRGTIFFFRLSIVEVNTVEETENTCGGG